MAVARHSIASGDVAVVTTDDIVVAAVGARLAASGTVFPKTGSTRHHPTSNKVVAAGVRIRIGTEVVVTRFTIEIPIANSKVKKPAKRSFEGGENIRKVPVRSDLSDKKREETPEEIEEEIENVNVVGLNQKLTKHCPWKTAKEHMFKSTAK